MIWEGLSPPYKTIVADPPWAYDEGWPEYADAAGKPHTRRPLPYSSMTIDDIACLPVAEIAASDAHLYLWTTNRYLSDAFHVMAAWGFRYSQTLVWCKPPQGIGPGGRFAITAEFVLFGSRKPQGVRERVETSWWLWNRGGHSVKPAGFFDVVERASSGPYVELFARQPRLGWDSWGHGYEQAS